MRVLAAHADWSVDPGKRWISIAAPDGAGWRIAAPALAGESGTLLARLGAAASGAPVLLGLDLPIGLPRAYAERHAAALAPDFPAFLRRLAARTDFFRVADSASEISAERPFYPARGQAGMRRSAVVAALGFDAAPALLRACERATAGRRVAAPLFWTLGAKQVGKAALDAWRHLLLPALASDMPPRLWPFDGPLSRLLAPDAVVVAETYPAEALCQLGLKIRGSKRDQASRAALGGPILAAMTALNAVPEPELARQTVDGFGRDRAGEDRLDSLIGLVGILGVLSGKQRDTTPADPWIKRWEGWILGQND
jgi:hypothetical protein